MGLPFAAKPARDTCLQSNPPPRADPIISPPLLLPTVPVMFVRRSDRLEHPTHTLNNGHADATSTRLTGFRNCMHALGVPRSCCTCTLAVGLDLPVACSSILRERVFCTLESSPSGSVTSHRVMTSRLSHLAPLQSELRPLTAYSDFLARLLARVLKTIFGRVQCN